MKQNIVALVTGVIFGLGLIISGMSNPDKTLNFFDFFGIWDPSLAFVMIGAIAVTLPGYRLITKREAPFLADRFHLPGRRDIDPHLITGAAVFGIGWGLSGFCPAPMVTTIPLLDKGTLAFAPAMLVGMMIAKRIKGNAGPGRLGATA